MTHYEEVLGGLRMPFPGFGTASYPSPEVLEQSVEAALEAGYRHLDTAYIYRDSEVTIGKVLKRWFDAGKIKREDLFITTKLPGFGLHPDKVEQFLTESLTRLQLKYVDLYLIHHPIYGGPMPPSESRGPPTPGDALPTDHLGTWKKLEEQVDAGRTKAIGVSNFDMRQVERIWQAARIKPACLQVKVSLFVQRPKLIKYCHDKGIVVVGYSMLNTRGQEDGGPTNAMANDVVSQIAKKYGKSNAQIVLRFFIQKKVIAIPKSTNAERIKANFNVFDFSLSADDVKTLEGLDLGKAGLGRSMADNPKNAGHPEVPVFDG